MVTKQLRGDLDNDLLQNDVMPSVRRIPKQCAVLGKRNGDDVHSNREKKYVERRWKLEKNLLRPIAASLTMWGPIVGVGPGPVPISYLRLIDASARGGESDQRRAF